MILCLIYSAVNNCFCDFQRVGCVCDMLTVMKSLCQHLWQNEVQRIDELRLKIVLRMLKSPHFNAKMNALREVGVLLRHDANTLTSACMFVLCDFRSPS